MTPQTASAITTTEFKRLIFDLWEHAPQTKIRSRTLGKMWETNFLQIIHVAASDSLIVQDNKAEQMKYISLSDVVEFEVESKFQNFSPHIHYHVTLP